MSEQRTVASDLYPEMPEKDFDLLVESMKRHGFLPQHRITRFHGEVIDGFHRERAARQAGIAPLYFDLDEVVGDDVEKANDYVVVANEVRRHLSAKARAARLLIQNPTMSARQVQRLSKASPHDVAVVKRALDKDPKLVLDVASGRKGVSGETLARKAGVAERIGVTRRRVKSGREHVIAWTVSAAVFRRMTKEAGELTGQTVMQFAAAAWKARVQELERSQPRAS